MCWKSDPPPPPSAGASGNCPPGSTTPCPHACGAMEIEINNTPLATDDLVQLKCTLPAARHTVPCRIRLRAAAASDSTVVLTNPDGRLRFPGDAATTLSLNVPRDGSWAAFDISGETGSAALNDAVIEAHCRTATGAVVATKTVTVFWFDQAQIGITPGGTYQMVGSTHTAVGGHGVDYAAQARIRPAGVDCAAPQVTNLRIGIMQNAPVPGTKTLRFGNPVITWSAGTPAHTVVEMPSTIELVWSRRVDSNDSEANVAPLYDQPGHPGSTLDENSLKPPLGCANGAVATSFDTPNLPVPPSLDQPALSTTGATVGSVRYTFSKLIEDRQFITWVVVFDTVSHDVCTLRERTWSLRLDSAAPGVHRATAAAADRAPTQAPITGAPFSNDVQTLAGPNRVGAAITRFTR